MKKIRNGFIKDFHFYFCLIGVIAIGLMAIVGCGGGGGGTTVTVQDVGHVEGIVVDAVTGHWLSGVTVKIGDKSDVTGDDGVYTITDLYVGSRIITAAKRGYQPYSGTVLVQKGTTVTHIIQMSPEGADTTAPTVSSTSPADGATDVPITSPITATFSEEMDASTITTDTFIVSDCVSDVTGTVTYSDTTATFTPSINLSYSATYIVTITTGVKDIAGNSMASDYSWSFTTEPEPTGVPGAPTNVSAVRGNGEVTIIWDSVTGATSYNIYWSTSSGVSKDTYEGKIEDITQTSYTHTDLTNGTTYYYVVTAENSYGESDESTEVSATPSATGEAPSTPTGVTPIPGYEEVTIIWDRVTGATSYNIYWSTSSGVSKDTYEGKIEDITQTSYTHTDLTNGTTYYYVVTAENSYGESDESGEVSATPSATGTAPSTPTNVTATEGDQEVTISWDSISGATSYNIYMDTSPGVSKTNFTEKRTVTATSYTWTVLVNYTTYYYIVTAENSYEESDKSDEVSATPGTAPSTPINVSATEGDQEVTISWDSVLGATSYNIYMNTSSGVSKTNFTERRTVTATSYTWRDLVNAITYFYVVTGENSYGESDESDEVSATPYAKWTKLLGSSENDSSLDIALDSNSNIYITGHTKGDLDGNNNAGGYDIFVSKFDTDGNKQWTKLLGSPETDKGRGIAVDSNSNIYITGSTGGDLDGNTNAGFYDHEDIFVSKFDTDGNKQWTRLLGTSSQDICRGIAVDSNSNIYVTGYTNGDLDGNNNAGAFDIFVLKYDTNGNKQWTKLLGTSDWDEGCDIALDSNSNIYITGHTKGDLDGNNNAGGWDIFVSKFDTDGNKQWTKLLGTSVYDIGYGIALDSNSNIYITGYTSGDLDGNNNAGAEDIFVAKYDTDGNKQWTKLLGASEINRGFGIAVHSDGNIYITGQTQGNLDGNTNAGGWDIFVSKFDTDGNKQRTELLGTSVLDSGWDIALDSNSNIYITGHTKGDLDGNNNAGGYDIFIWKLMDFGM